MAAKSITCTEPEKIKISCETLKQPTNTLKQSNTSTTGFTMQGTSAYSPYAPAHSPPVLGYSTSVSYRAPVFNYQTAAHNYGQPNYVTRHVPFPPPDMDDLPYSQPFFCSPPAHKSSLLSEQAFSSAPYCISRVEPKGNPPRQLTLEGKSKPAEVTSKMVSLEKFSKQSGIQSFHNGKNQKRKRIKIERLEDSSSAIPLNTLEARVMYQLRGMGFSSSREVLEGIRYVTEEQKIQYCNSTLFGSTEELVDRAMLRIVSQREAADDARCLDKARIISEMSREEENLAQTCKRQKDEEVTLVNASICTILQVGNTTEQIIGNNAFFLTSIVLKSEKIRSALHEICNEGDINAKLQVIRFLTLEKKALKWYGITTAYAYFEYDSLLGIRSPQSGNNNNDKDGCSANQLVLIFTECDALERALYSLSEQDMNVPKMFLQSRRKAKGLKLPLQPAETNSKGCANSQNDGTITGNEHDEVVVLDVDEATYLRSSDQKDKHVMNDGTAETAVEEINVIEIM